MWFLSLYSNNKNINNISSHDGDTYCTVRSTYIPRYLSSPSMPCPACLPCLPLLPANDYLRHTLTPSKRREPNFLKANRFSWRTGRDRLFVYDMNPFCVCGSFIMAADRRASMNKLSHSPTSWTSI